MRLKESLLNTLLLLRNDPTATHESIGKQLNVAPNTIKARILKLKELGIIRDDEIYDDPVLGKRERSEVVALYSPASIGLRRVHILFDQISDHVSVKKIDEMLQDHPYTYYKVRYYGIGTGIYTQLDLPPSAVDVFIKWIEEKYQGKHCKKIIHFTPKYFINTFDDLQFLQTEFSQWSYRVPPFLKNSGTSVMSPYDRKPEKLKAIDLRLLRELTINGKVKLSNIKENYSVDLSTLSRRVKKLKENGCIQRYNLIYDRSKFNLDSVYLIYGKIPEFNAYLETFKKFPFLSNLSFDDEDNFIWYVYCPASIVGQLFAELFKISRVNIFIVHQETSTRYYFYPENMGANGWKEEKDYVCPHL